MKKTTLGKRALSILLCLVMVASYLPVGIMTAVAEGSATALTITKVADPSTKDGWDAYFDHGAQVSTDNAGGIWTDKSVFTDASAFSNVTTDSEGQPVSITMKNENDLLVALSALASNMTISGQASVPTDTMLVLDVSGSMANSNVDDDLASAANTTIAELLGSNPNNRVGVVLYSGPRNQGGSASSTDAVLLLPLGRYTTGSDKNYVSYSGGSISLDRDVRIEGTNTRPSTTSKSVVGATYIQKGVILAMNQLTATSNQTAVNGVTRKPILVLMSDGAPTVSDTDFTNPDSYDLGDGTNNSTNAAQGFVTQLSCAYAKAQVEAKYGTDALFYTIGLGTTGNQVATSVLNPTASNSGINAFWESYNNANVGGTVLVQSTNWSSRSVTKIQTPLEQNYVDKYIAVRANTDLAQGLKDAFAAIVADIQLQSKYFPTLVGDSHNLSGYVSFVDKIGSYMSVKDVKGILLHEQLFSGHHLAQNFVEGGGILGTEAAPTAAGTAMMESVRDRLGVGSNDAAISLINNAYYYGQLAFDPATGEFSNYIGWYADARGAYMGFYQEGVTQLPSDAVYTVKSYGFLGETDPAHGVSQSDMMYATVQVRLNIATGEEEMILKIPASLIPTITYEVELDENGDLENLTQTGASYPFRLLYEVGLDPHINSLNLTEYVSADYLKANTNADGSVSFYSNKYELDNSTGYGKVNTFSYFNPSHQNDKYYFQANAMVYADQNGTLYTGSTAPSANGGTLYRQHISYEIANGQLVTDIHYHALSAEAKAATKQTTGSNTWYVPEGTVYTNLEGFTYYKGYTSTYDASKNVTGTLPYAKQPFVDVYGHTVDETDHNFTIGSTLGNNGKLTVTPATGIKLTKEMAEGVTDPGTAFTFTLENLTSTSDSGTYAAVLVNTDGTQTDTTVTFSAGKATVQLKAGEILYITGLTATAQYKITENETDDYVAVQNTTTVTVLDKQMVEASFVNALRGKGNLMITKELEHAQAGHTIPASMLDTIFPITVQLPANLAGKTVTVNDGTGDVVNIVPGSGQLSMAIRHGQTIAIKDLTEGTQVTVTEGAQFSPFAFKQINSRDHSGATLDNDGTVTIGNNTNSTVIIHNTYTPAPTNAHLNVTLTKDFQVESSLSLAADFTFALQKWNGTVWEDMDTGTITYSAGQTGEKTIDLYDIFQDITYTEAGDYAYQIIEKIPADADKLPGITYDRTTWTFTVHVVDNGGQLVATVTDDGMNVGDTYNVEFTNTYHTAPVSIDVVKEVSNTANNPETTKTGFVFEAYEANADWTLVDNTADLTVLSDAVGEARFSATYNQAGTHYFVVKEANSGKPGWSYDTTEYHVTVVITEEVDGNLVPTMTIEKVTAAGTETVTGSTITFSNSYDPTDTSLNLDGSVRKNLVGRPLQDTEFTFGVFPDGQASHASTQNAVLIGMNKVDGSVNFTGMLTFDKIGTYRYDVVEMVNDMGGITYDSRIYDLVVEVTDNGQGQLEATYYYEDSTTQTVTFTNTYTAQETSYTVTGSKVLTGRAQINDEFTFTMVEVADANGTTLANAQSWTTTNTMAGTFAFPAITYTAPGVHYYKVTEVQQATAGGITFDQTAYIVTVTVIDNGEGQLVASGQINANAIVFENHYVPAKTSGTIPGDKVLEGKVLGAGAYQFQLYDSNAAWENLGTKGQPVANDANGKFSFPEIEYTSAGTYYYLVKEVDGGKTIEGVTYDDSTFRVMVEVTDDLKGQLHATTTVFDENDIPQIGVQFVNTYAVVGDASLVLTGTKTLNGRDMVDGEFVFELYETSEAFTVLGDLVTTTTNAAGQFTIKLDYTAKDDLGKTYEYKLVEKNAGQILNGVHYSTQYYLFIVTVEDDGVGGIKLTVNTVANQITQDKLTTVSGLDFVNNYYPRSTELFLQGTKQLEGTRDLNTNDFTFQLYTADSNFVVSGNPVLTTTNDGSGLFIFPSYTIDSAGKHYFVVKESSADPIPGVTYDQTAYHVTVTVGDNLFGMLEVTNIAYQKVTAEGTTAANGIAFTNYYDAADAAVTLSGNKTLTGKVLAADMFTFQLYKTDLVFSTAGVTPVEVKNAIDGTYSFDALTFDKAGTYYYVVKEANGGATIDGITYDDTVYEITIQVNDQNGKLIPRLTVTGGNVSVTENVATVTNLNFANTYTATPATHQIQAIKRYERPDGEAMKAFTFTLTGEAMNQSKQNDATGKIVFDQLTFTKTGTYTYTVSEVIPANDDSIKYDTNVYTVTIVVADNGKGALVISSVTTASVKGPNDLEFLNAHEDLILKKEVVLENSTVSIDGKTVEPGDILVYNITYTNYNNQVVDATVTDTLPQYTQFVSATNGGTYANGKVTWDLQDVAVDSSVVVSFKVKVTATAGQTVTNQATVLDAGNTYTSNEVKNPVKEDKVEKDVFTPASPTVSIDGKTVNKGALLVYKITYTNSDDFAATVTITDTIPAHTTYVNGTADNGGVYADGKVTWNLQLAAGETRTVSFHVMVEDVNVTITNQASAVEGNNTLTTNEVTNPVKEDSFKKDVFVAGNETISIDGKSVEKGDVLTYKLTYQNVDDLAADVTITDNIPNGTEYVAASASDGGAFANGTLTWNLKLAAGETKTITFQVKVVGAAGTTAANKSTAIEGANTYTTNSVTNPITEDEVEKDVFLAGNETISIDGLAVEKGDVLVYQITYKNNDSFDAQVKITDKIPAYTEYVAASASDSGVLENGTLTWNVTVPANSTKTVTFKVTVTGAAAQTVINQATALEGNNSYTTEEVKNPITEDEVKKDVFLADETVSIDGKAAEKGDVLTYKITYKNTDDFAAAVTITDTIPAHTEYVANSASDNAVFADGKLTWNLQLAAGEEKTVSFQVKVTGTKVTVENTAQAKEGNNTFDTNSTRIPVEEDLVTKDVFAANAPTVSIDGKKVDKGDILLYTVTYENLDGFDAKVTITDVIPEHATYVEGSASDSATFADGKLTWNLQLAAGEKKTVSFQVKVTGAAGVTVTNQATAIEGSNTIVTNKVENPVTEDALKKDVVVPTEPTISIDSKTVNPGQILQYQITYKNTDDLAAEVTITDTIPAHTTYVAGSATDAPVLTNNQLVWTLTLAAGEEKTVTFQVKVTDANASITNQATALEGENKYESNQTTTPTKDDVLKKEVAKVSEPTVSVDGKQVAMGEALVYTITYTNTDATKATATITDVIPANTTYVEDSATESGVFSNGTLTWELTLEPGESKTVSFQVKTNTYKATVTNQATAFDGTNQISSNQVTVTTPAAPQTPQTGDSMNLVLWFTLLTVSGLALAAAVIFRKKLLQ